MQIHANYVDILNKKIFEAYIFFDEKINKIEKLSDSENESLPYILPGFIDSHVHIESSMLIPSEFARIAVLHGTVATVSDPHEIANVCGMEGVKYMIENGKKVPFKFFFGAPSCVPATQFETAGAEINSDAVRDLLAMNEVLYLSEMMNFPGVLHNEEEVMKKIKYAHQAGKPVDGHAPGLTGESARNYAAAGISTDHECYTYEEAKEKIGYGMKILIREGSAAKNFEALIDLLHEYENDIMFCSDDKHPDSLILGHINQLCERAVAKNIDVFKVLKAACINPAKHYKLNVGLLNINDPSDFILVNNLKNFAVESTYINGELVAQSGKSFISSIKEKTINRFVSSVVQQEDLQVPLNNCIRDADGNIPVIEAIDGQLITLKQWLPPTVENDFVQSNTEKDILKIVVINRYAKARPAVGFIKNFGFRKGAIASTVAHDSHNVIAVGADDKSIAAAINALMQSQGGVSIAVDNTIDTLPLPVAGLMTNEDAFEVARQYEQLDIKAKSLGSELQSPYMTLSFMALLVIPHLKLSDKGLFDCDAFRLM